MTPFRKAIFASLTVVIAVCGLAARQAAPFDLLITGGRVATMDAGDHNYDPGYIAVRSGRIVEVGPVSPGARRPAAREFIDATGKVVLPGLINTHTHAPMVLFRGLADDLALK